MKKILVCLILTCCIFSYFGRITIPGLEKALNEYRTFCAISERLERLDLNEKSTEKAESVNSKYSNLKERLGAVRDENSLLSALEDSYEESGVQLIVQTSEREKERLESSKKDIDCRNIKITVQGSEKCVEVFIKCIESLKGCIQIKRLEISCSEDGSTVLTMEVNVYSEEG